jgi:hypothetical protein
MQQDILTKRITPRKNSSTSDKALLKAKLQLAELDRRSKKTSGVSNRSLHSAIEMALDAESMIPAEQDTILEAMAEIKKNSPPEDTRTIIELKYLDYQFQLIEIQTLRAVDYSKKRQLHLANLNTKDKIEEELRRCREGYTDSEGNYMSGIHYWFYWYAWIVDPRPDTPIYAQPFIPYSYQTTTIDWLISLIFKQRRSGVIEKSRDMGVTWLILCLFIYYWIFASEAKQFHAMIASYNSDEVDKKGVPSTLFEKIRLHLKLIPVWMMPKGWKGEVPFMRLVNPETGSTIIGETANADMGRSGRFTVIFFDEFASLETDREAWRAAAQSTKTRLAVSTPKGKLNLFYELAAGVKTPRLTLKWTMHPFKNEIWYEGQKLEMSDEDIAQELDIDYNASQPGRVFKTYDEVYMVITQSEFADVIKGAIDPATGRFSMPKNGTFGMSQDVGNSEGHDNISLWFWVAPKGSPKDLAGSVFIYREHVADFADSTSVLAKKIKRFEYPNSEPLYMERKISWEAIAEVKTYAEHGLHFERGTPDANAGISMVRDYIEIEKFHLPHPFHKPLLGADSKPVPIMGRPKLYIIVKDGQGELQYNLSTNRYFTTPANPRFNPEGMGRLRQEFPLYHYPKSEAGKAARKQKPAKIFDDAMDCLRQMADKFFPPIAPASKNQMIEETIPYHLQQEVIKLQPIEEWGRSYIARREYFREHQEEIEKKLNPSIDDFREQIYKAAVRMQGKKYETRR